MLTVQLSVEQMKRLTALALRHELTRSQLLRNAIERQMATAEAVIDSHAVYLDLMAGLADKRGSGGSDGARQHSKVLKQKLHASRRG